jgi:hypothetical protein
MFAIPGILALVTFIYARLQEFVELLQLVPLLHVFFGLAAFGIALDMRLGNSRLKATPQLLLVALFFIWCLVTVIFSAPTNLAARALELSVCVALYLVIAHGVQSFRALHLVSGLLLGLVLMVAAVGVHQGYADKACIAVDESVLGDTTTGKSDGRPCDSPRECYLGSAEPGAQYLCEHIGLFGTTSIEKGRVRYRGVLQDPNELALAVGIGLPLAFAFAQLPGRKLPRRALTLITLGLVVMCAIFTRSRGGQLVFLAVLAAYFVQRFGRRGLLVGGVLALPLLLLGGRSGADASASTKERIDCWYEALMMWKEHPLTGVGFGQFGEYHYLTAHNSYMLALAELGFVGLLIFSAIIYVSLKVPLTLLRRVGARETVAAGPGAAAVFEPWAMALVAAWSGLLVGIFFLSFAYHYVLWIYIGLSGALYSAVRQHDPEFEVKFGWRDLWIVGAIDLALIVAVFGYARWALG